VFARIARIAQACASRSQGGKHGKTTAIVTFGAVARGQLRGELRRSSAGWGKLTNVAGATGYFTSLGIPSPELMPYLVGGLEFVLGICLILGLATRYAAVVAFIFVLVATAIAHRYWTYPPQAQAAQYGQFTKNLAIMGGALYVLVSGAGRFSLDAMLRR
jgi:putative oxidoreductase